MKMTALWTVGVIVGSSATFVHSTDKSFLEFRCAPSRIQEGLHVSKVNFCQTSKSEGRMDVFSSKDFGLESQRLVNQGIAKLELGSSETMIQATLGEFLFEAKPNTDRVHSWLGTLKRSQSVLASTSLLPSLKGEVDQEFSCRVAFVSKCQ